MFNQKNKSSLTNRGGSNREPEQEEQPYRISRGKKRTVIKCQETNIPIPLTTREYQHKADNN